MNKLIVAVCLTVGCMMNANAVCSTGCYYGSAYYGPAIAAPAGTVVVQQTQPGLLPVVGDMVSGVAGVIFGSNRATTTVVAAPATVTTPVVQNTVVNNPVVVESPTPTLDRITAGINAIPVPTLGHVFPAQYETKVFVPGRYVSVRTTYGEVIQVWQSSHYEKVIIRQ